MKKLIDFPLKVVKVLTAKGKKIGIKKFKNYIEYLSEQDSKDKLIMK